MTTPFADLQREDRRLCVLRFLAEDSDYKLNDSMLDDALTAIGHAVSRDALRADLHWLAEQGLVTNEQLMAGRVWVVTLTGRGADVAAGRATHPGVKRPRPGA